jgi:hypothetical protein
MLDWIRQVLPPSGGLFYHYLALRFSKTLWGPFKEDVAYWLRLWNPKSKSLVIFGSSAGYSIQRDFLQRFERVICVEPDPLARLLFKRRFSNARIEFIADTNLLAPVPEGAKGSTSKRVLQRLHEFLQRYPDAAVLFANVLGQLPLEFPHLNDQLFASHLVAVRAAVKDREWASYHDLLSTWVHPKKLGRFELPAGPLELDEFARNYLEAPPPGGFRYEITDHQTHSLSAGGPTLCTWWELAPGRYHLIGFLFSSKKH